MRKLLSTLSFLAIINANAQVTPDFTVKNETVFKNDFGKVTEQKTSLIESKTNKATYENETIITIQNIKKRVSILEINTSKTDTVRTTTEGSLVDSDEVNVTGKDKKRVHKNLLIFVNKPTKINTTKDEEFIVQSSNSPNITAKFISHFPVFNRNAVFTPILLNFSPEKEFHSDTTYSEHPKGIFITNYSKNTKGYDIKGRFVQSEIVFDNTRNNVLYNSYEYWNYFGEIVCDKNFITNMSIKNETKYKYNMIFNSKDEGIEMVNNYAMVVKNEFK